MLVALACSPGARAASLSLSDVKMNARTSADEWEYQKLTDGYSRSNETDIEWLIHLPTYTETGVHDLDLDADKAVDDEGKDMPWPIKKSPTKGQLWASNALWGGVFDYAGEAQWWHGPREWARIFHSGGNDNEGGYSAYAGTYNYFRPLSKAHAYSVLSSYWCGGSTGIRHNGSARWGGSGVGSGNGHVIAKSGYFIYHHYVLSPCPDFLDIPAAETGEDIGTTHQHIAYLRGAARMYGKPWAVDFSDWMDGYISDYGGWWQTAAESVSGCCEVMTNDGILAWLTESGAAYWKLPGTKAALSITTGVLELAVGDDPDLRFVFRTAGHVKAGRYQYSYDPLSCCIWTNIRGDGTSSGVSDILDVSGDRVAMLLNDNSVVVRDGSTDRAYAGSYAKGWLDGNHVVLLGGAGQLRYESAGQLAGALANIDSSVRDAAVAGSSILYEKTDGRLYYKADLTTGSPVEVRSRVAAETAAGIRDFALVEHSGGSRIGVLYNNGVLRVGATPASIAAASSKRLEHVDRFRMAGNRVAAVQEGDDGMQVLKVRDGLAGSWVPMMWVRMADFGLSSGADDDVLFVQTLRDQKLLVKNNGLEEMEYTGTDSDDETNYAANYKVWSFNDTTQFNNTTWASHLWGGHSESLERRIAYATYMGGANVLYWEAGGVRLSLGRKNSLSTDANGVETGPATLSKEGVMAMHYYDFTKRTLPHEERGIAWAPVAIMLDAYHGMTYSEQAQIWLGYIPVKAPDRMNFGLMAQIWLGGIWRDRYNLTQEYRFQVNGAYGEIFDVLTEWAPADVIANYPVVLMSGEIRPGTTLRKRLIDYVNGGGNLIINGAMNVADFGETFTGVILGTAASRSVPGLRWKIDNSTTTFSTARSISAQPMTRIYGATTLLETTDSTPVTLASIRTHGQGRVIVVGLPNLEDQQFWGFLLKKLSENAAVNPFRVSGDIMYQVNYKGSDAWLVTLTNNRGVNKTSSNSGATLQTFTASAARTVSLKLQEAGRAVSSVTEYPIFHGIWKTPSGATAHADDAFTVTVGPGQTRVFEVVTEASSG